MQRSRRKQKNKKNIKKNSRLIYTYDAYLPLKNYPISICDIVKGWVARAHVLYC